LTASYDLFDVNELQDSLIYLFFVDVYVDVKCQYIIFFMHILRK